MFYQTVALAASPVASFDPAPLQLAVTRVCRPAARNMLCYINALFLSPEIKHAMHTICAHANFFRF